MSKLIILTAPSGAGKTTIVRHLLQHFDSLAFSVSATTRPRRDYEVDGRDYYFISVADFRNKIAAGEFLEWQEVYSNMYYGTLHSEVDRLWKAGKHIVFDIDVKGAVNIKQAYPNETLAIFIKPPSPEVLLQRLQARKTETPETLRKRIIRAREELSYEQRFDTVIVNDDLDKALREAEQLVADFIGS